MLLAFTYSDFVQSMGLDRMCAFCFNCYVELIYYQKINTQLLIRLMENEL
jgi:hypothetical protein